MRAPRQRVGSVLPLVLAAAAVPLVALAFSRPGSAAGPGDPALERRDLRDAQEEPASATAGLPPAAIPAERFGAGPLHKVQVSADDVQGRARLVASGAIVRSVDYGGFLLAVVDERLFGGADALRRSGLRVRDELDLMVFNEIVLDGTRPAETLRALPAAERFTDPDTLALDPASGLYVVQFEGPPRDEWLAGLSALGSGFAQPVPMNGLVVRVAPGQVAALETWGRTNPFVQYVGAYEPAFRMHAALRAMAREGKVNEAQSVTIQLVNLDGARAAVDAIRSMADAVESVRVVGPYVNVSARVHPVFFPTLAAQAVVFQVEPRGRIETMDERQGQIMAAQTTASGPSAPGYLAWLASKGFSSSQFTSFAVNVADDATSLTGHPDLASSRVAFTLNPTGQTGSQGGHGFLNAHIVAGLNSGTGSANEDAGGYNYGLGIAPWARVGSTAIFGAGALDPSTYESSAYASGARISTNSWGFQTQFGGPVPDYDAWSQEYDFLTRDVQSGTTGNQQYLVVFSAGNNGSGSNTVSTPGTGKNVLTVGASENDRQTGTDGCGISNSGANNYNDLATFSSHGPVNSSGGDGRWKPELVAPGTHIEAGVPQSNYNGSSVCNAYWPSGQTLYGWSSGTSHSTPAVAGGAALVYQDFLNRGLGAPSPAMTKAVLVAGARYMTGALANDTLPSNAQGMGNANLDRSIDATPRLLLDQTQVLGASGQSHVVTGSIATGAQPFRVALVWTDAPGPTSGAPYVNDLDLRVTVGGTTYLGNVFSGANSTTGGVADFRNNTESVFLPAGTTGSFTITVEAASISGDGVPGNGDASDQDFALFVYNATSGPAGPDASFFGTPTSGNAPLQVSFSDTSSGGPTAWSWTFGDGGTSSAQNPVHTYASPGSYSVTLSITAPGGNDATTLTNYITVSTPPAPGIADGSFESQSAGSAPATPWSTTGSGHVVNPAGGTSADGGMPSAGTQWAEISGTSTNNGTPPSNPGGFGSPPAGGAGVSQTFSYAAGASVLSFDAAFLRNESAGSTYNDWMSVDVSDGSSSLNLYYADTFTTTVGTSSKYGYPITALAHVSVDLAAAFPSSSPSTSFTLTAVTANGTDGVQPSLGYVDAFALGGGGPAAPVASFVGSPTSGNAPLLVGFTDLSTGSITSWAWTFGDGGTSSAQSPSHTYTSAGTYSVSLTVTGPGGNDTLTRTSYVTVGTAPAPPVASFTGSPTSGTAPLLVSFSDASTGSITSWSWTFGDGGTSSAQSPSHTYTSAGTYSVSLTVTGPGGNDTLTRTSYVSVTAGGGGAAYYMSFDTDTSVPGVGTVADEDIVRYSPGTGTWSLYLDGSDVGLSGTDVNAFHVRGDGSILMSFDSTSFSVPGLIGGPSGTTVQDRDVVLFVPTSVGSTTAGTFSFHFDGSDVGLTTTNEDIDGLYEFSDGSIGISTVGAVSGTGASGNDEDVLRFSGTFGSSTSGSFTLYFDGSDVGFNASSNYELNAIAFDASGLLFSTLGTYAAAGGSGADEDVSRFVGSFGTATSGSASLLLDLSALGISTAEDVDGLSYQP